MTVSRDGLVAQLKHQETACRLGLGMLFLAHHPPSMAFLKTQHIYLGRSGLGNAAIDSDAIVLGYEHVGELASFDRGVGGEGPLKEYAKVLFGALLTVSYELVKDYCEETGQGELFRRAPWYQFYRTIRNSLSHDFHFQLSRTKAGDLIESEWRGRRILASLAGHPIPIVFLGFDGMWQLFEDLREYVGTAIT